MEISEYERLCADHYAGVVRAAFLVVGDRQEALDIAQETFARAYERWSQVSKMQNQAGWLYRVATNLAITRLRRLRRDHLGARQLEVAAPEPSDPSLAKALRKLTPAQRAAVVLRFHLDLSIDAAAEVLHKRAGTVRALTSQGVARLREELGDSWLEVRDE